MIHTLLQSPIPIPDWWQSSEPQLQRVFDGVRLGEVNDLAVSPGGRPVRYVVYGQKDAGRMGTANFNSALAAGKPEAYCRRGKASGMKPVLFVLAGVHGQEMEGMVAACSLIRIMETGRDIAGAEQPALKEMLDLCRLVMIPLANPDGRARVPYAGWAGLPSDEMTKWGQGTHKDGTPWRWPDCKAMHPMRGDVGILGGYFDDNGINMMHDEWHSPMSAATRALMELTAREGPDMLLNLHSHSFGPCILPVSYIPASAKRHIQRFARDCCHVMQAEGYETGGLPGIAEDGLEGAVPPPFAMGSMLYHAGCGAPILYESPHGCTGYAGPYGYGDILGLHHILFERAARFLLSE